MPPKAAVARAVSPTPPPPPPPHNDAQDILIIQDFMDTVDQIPVELTRVHSDLNELGAVLYSTLCNLERKLHQLIDWVQNPRIGPERRFQLLQEIAEEAARYKLGGDDKIRVAGGACDGIMAHQRHISDLLAASTLLDNNPPSPYTVALTLPAAPLPAPTRRGGRTTGSPFNDRGTPTKRKKNRAAQVSKDDDDASSVNGKDNGKKVPVKRKKANRAVSPSESVASNTYGKAADPGPRTARQIAAAAAKQRAAQKAAEESDDDSDHDELRRTTTTTATKAQPMQVTESTDSLAPGGGALGIDIGTSREGSAGKTAAAAPAPPPPAKRAARGTKRQRGEEDDEEDEDDLEEEERPAKRTGTAVAKKAAAATTTTTAVAAAVTPVDDFDTGDADTTGGDNEVDSKVYCTCRQFSYGEYHVACLNLDKAPEGNWICPQCLERRKRNPKPKKPSKAGKRK